MQEARQKAGFCDFSGGLKETCRGDLRSPAQDDLNVMPYLGELAEIKLHTGGRSQIAPTANRVRCECAEGWHLIASHRAGCRGRQPLRILFWRTPRRGRRPRRPGKTRQNRLPISGESATHVNLIIPRFNLIIFTQNDQIEMTAVCFAVPTGIDAPCPA